MTHSIRLPALLEIGGGALNNAATLLASLGVSKPCIITDPMMVELGHADKLLNSLATKGITAGLFSDTLPEPTDSSLLPAVSAVTMGNYDGLLALGGGSVIDSAKAIAILVTHGGHIRDYKVPVVVDKQGLPLIAIPTTAGTGSESTRFTVITDTANNEKMLCMGRGFLPTAAIIDYHLTLTLPPRVTADTGLDALTHAIEAFVSKKANSFSDQQALAALRLIGPNIRNVFHQPNNHLARESMMLGATLAGMAFSNASVALVHGMSRPLGAHFHVPHGLSNAMLLPSLTEFSLSFAANKYAECAIAMGLCEAKTSIEAAHNCLINELCALNKELSVPSPKAWGIDKTKYFELLPVMAEQAQASGSPANNPKEPSLEEMCTLYTKAWDA